MSSPKGLRLTLDLTEDVFILIEEGMPPKACYLPNGREHASLAQHGRRDEYLTIMIAPVAQLLRGGGSTADKPDYCTAKFALHDQVIIELRPIPQIPPFQIKLPRDVARSLVRHVQEDLPHLLEALDLLRRNARKTFRDEFRALLESYRQPLAPKPSGPDAEPPIDHIALMEQVRAGRAASAIPHAGDGAALSEEAAERRRSADGAIVIGGASPFDGHLG